MTYNFLPPSPFEFCTGYGIYTVRPCVKLQNDQTTERHDMEKQDFVRYEFEISCFFRTCDVITWTLFRVTGLCEGNSPVPSEFPSQRASNADFDDYWMWIRIKNVEWPSIWDYMTFMWRHYNEYPILQQPQGPDWSTQTDFEQAVASTLQN